MDYHREDSLKNQSSKSQAELLLSLEKDDNIHVILENKGTLSGSVTSVIPDDSSKDFEEIHVQFLDYQSNYRNDDKPHHTVSLSQLEDGEWKQAELSYSVSDTGRVRTHTVDKVEQVWPTHYSYTFFSPDEEKVILMKDLGLTNQEIAERWDCNESKIDHVLALIRRKYKKAEQTVDALQSSSIETEKTNNELSQPLEGSTINQISMQSQSSPSKCPECSSSNSLQIDGEEVVCSECGSNMYDWCPDCGSKSFNAKPEVNEMSCSDCDSILYTSGVLKAHTTSTQG
jgi:hypothetical protein